MNPRTFTDRNGDEITVSECDNGVCVSVEGQLALAERADLPAIVAALYEAAGLPAPVILEGCGEVTKATIGGVRVYLAEDGKVGIGGEKLPPALARQVARIVVCVADAAESGPSPAEVESLTAHLERDGYRGPAIPAAARSALRWMRNHRGAS